MQRNRKLIAVILVLGLMMLACASLEVYNSSGENVVVKIEYSDSTVIRTLPSKSSTTSAAENGWYTITVLEYDSYTRQAESTSANLEAALFSNPPPSADQARGIKAMIGDLMASLREMTSQLAYCENRIQDEFLSDVRAEVTISQDTNGTWSATCTEGKAEEPTE